MVGFLAGVVQINSGKFTRRGRSRFQRTASVLVLVLLMSPFVLSLFILRSDTVASDTTTSAAAATAAGAWSVESFGSTAAHFGTVRCFAAVVAVTAEVGETLFRTIEVWVVFVLVLVLAFVLVAVIVLGVSSPKDAPSGPGMVLSSRGGLVVGS